jgi:NAD(P)-dependent dehydrogenase (short-subunit alcohol dehydrogenase family)
MTTPTLSAYSMSKMASARLSEYIALEHPNICAVALQPGVVKTDMVTGVFNPFSLLPTPNFKLNREQRHLQEIRARYPRAGGWNRGMARERRSALPNGKVRQCELVGR